MAKKKTQESRTRRGATTPKGFSQIAPAEGWVAVWFDDPDKEEVGRVACWGMTAGKVVGLVPDPDGGSLVDAESFDDFRGYVWCAGDDPAAEVDQFIRDWEKNGDEEEEEEEQED